MNQVQAERMGNCGLHGMYRNDVQKAAFQFLSEKGKKCELFGDYFSRSPLRIAANLVVSSWAYQLSIHSWFFDFHLAEFLESWVTSWLVVCWKLSLLV